MFSLLLSLSLSLSLLEEYSRFQEWQSLNPSLNRFFSPSTLVGTKLKTNTRNKMPPAERKEGKRERGRERKREKRYIENFNSPHFFSEDRNPLFSIFFFSGDLAVIRAIRETLLLTRSEFFLRKLSKGGFLEGLVFCAPSSVGS
jgi:hypothetical protein